jgi:hypothetical protein
VIALHFVLPLNLNWAASEAVGSAIKPHAMPSEPRAAIVIRFISVSFAEILRGVLHPVRNLPLVSLLVEGAEF